MPRIVHKSDGRDDQHLVVIGLDSSGAVIRAAVRVSGCEDGDPELCMRVQPGMTLSDEIRNQLAVPCLALFKKVCADNNIAIK